MKGGALVAAEVCNVTNVRECYSKISNHLYDAIEQRFVNMSALEDLCKANDTAQHCEEDLTPCIDSDPSLQAVRTQYTSRLEDVCPRTGFRDSETDEEDTTNDEEQNESKCWYKQLRRCLQRQINQIRIKMTKIVARNEVPKPWTYDGICRRTRKSCHQISTVEACPQVLQDAISKMEDSMNTAQALLCKDNRTLLRNLLQSYKYWNVTQFTRCATNIKVVHIADYLFATKRLQTECKKLKTRMVRCLQESYSSVHEAQPKPDVAGATKVLEAFLDQMHCVGSRNVSDDVNSDENNNQRNGSSDDPEGQPDSGGTKTSSFGNLTVSGGLNGGATSFDILASVPVALLSINIIFVLFSV
ncbi:hypothetical protein MTO96_052381 [Rhipicephalus appendiculatus]